MSEQGFTGDAPKSVPFGIAPEAADDDEPAAPEQPSVDWLDPARESCLIDGVRYRREGEWRETWALLTLRHGGEILAYTYQTEQDAHDANWKMYANRGTVDRILVPASPEPDKETP